MRYAGEVHAVVGAVQAPGVAALSPATAAGASALGLPAGVAGARPAATAVTEASPATPAAATPVVPPNDAAGERAEVARLSNAGDVDSRKYASGASGTLHVFQSEDAAAGIGGKMWRDVERPRLEELTDEDVVTKILPTKGVPNSPNR